MSRQSPDAALALEMTPEEAEQGLFGDLMELTKARLSLLVVVTTFVGFCMGSQGAMDWWRLFCAVFGTALAAASAAVLNQVAEVRVDRLMERTRSRPLPSGRMRRSTALVLGVAIGVVGVAFLWLTVNAISAWLAAATIVVYLLLYTPLKRRTAYCTWVGAVSGAIPPMIGWAAVRGSLDLGAWALFGILFTWQMPHFLAIAWMYRDEYAQAGFVMLRRDDASGFNTAVQSLLFTVVLSLITVIPFSAGLAGSFYLAGALGLDAAMMIFAGQFFASRERSSARRLFFASILYLPLLLGLMVFNKG